MAKPSHLLIISLILSLIASSCKTDSDKEIPSEKAPTPIELKSEKESPATLEINIDKEKAIRYGTSTTQIGQEIQKLILGPDSLSYEELLDTNLVFRNNKGKWVNVPFRNLIK